jgi:beta-glucosidase
MFGLTKLIVVIGLTGFTFFVANAHATPSGGSAQAPVISNSQGPFVWGISTAPYQTEDVAEATGAPTFFETDWDLFFKAGKLPEPKGNGTYSYSEVDRDLAAIKSLGVTHYRFGIEWARIEPVPGVYNDKALEHYVELVKKTKAMGLTPVVCLWHFTFPSWTTDLSHAELNGWLHPKTQERWQPYVEHVVRALAPYVEYYAPQNEPNAQALAAYVVGSFPPGSKYKFDLFDKQISAAARAFNQASVVIKRLKPKATVITIQNIIYWEKAPWDIFDFFWRKAEAYNFAHLDLVRDHADWIGFNYYYKLRASPFPNQRLEYPEGLEEMIHVLGDRFKKPVLITENGVADSGDEVRSRYLRTHIEAVLRAAGKGADVRGYFFWSLIDNFEWAYGYKEKFGLFSMADDRTLKPKPSVEVYKKFVRENRSLELIQKSVH